MPRGQKITSRKRSATPKPDSLLTEQDLIVWTAIESLDWSKDHDLKRVQIQTKKWSMEFCDEVASFVFDKTEALMKKFKFTGLSDSRSWDLFAEVVSKGKATYYGFDKVALEQWIEQDAFVANFEYCFL